MKYRLATVLLCLWLLTIPAQAQEILKGGVQWDEDKAREFAIRHIERQIDVQPFQNKDARYFENIRQREQNPDLKFKDRQVTRFPGGEYSVVYTGEKNVHYFRKNGTLFKVSVCDTAYGTDKWDYPRRCIEYSYPAGTFLSVSMDVSPEESYVFDLQGNLMQHWKDEQGFTPTDDDTTWERWNQESQPVQSQQK